MQRLRKLSFTLLLMSLMTLVACGGGDGDLTGGGGGDTATTISLSKSDGNLSGDNDIVLNAKVMKGNTAVANKLVTFVLTNSTVAIFSPEVGTAVTNSNGIATITVKATNVSGGVEVTASISDSSVTNSVLGFTSVGGGVEPDKVVLSLSKSDGDLSGVNDITLTATLKKGTVAITNELVTFKLTDSDLALFLPEAGTAVTNNNGIATILVKATNKAGGVEVTASVSDSNVNDVKLSFNSIGGGSGGSPGGPVADSITLFASSQQLASSDAQEIILTALAKDSRNQLLENVAIDFTADSGSLGKITNDAGEIQTLTGPDGKLSMKLTTPAEQTNRIIKIEVKSGLVSDNIEIEVVGTIVTLTGSSSLAINDDNTYIVKVLDSDGEGIPKSTVNFSLTDTANNIEFPETVETDFTGQASVTVKGVLGGSNTIIASSLGANASKDVTIQSDSFLFSNFGDGTNDIDPGASSTPDILLSKTANITLTWLRSGVPVTDGTPVNFTATRGTLTSNSGVTVNGQVTTSLNSTNAGKALVTFVGQDNAIELANQLEFEFVADTASTIITQASPSSIGPNGQTSTISVVVRDPLGNLVKNKTIDFVLTDTSGGAIFPASAVTDSNGSATTVYTSNSTSAQNSVNIKATVNNTNISDSVNLTVADRELFISLGTGNSISEPNDTEYIKRYSVFVTDADSNPVPDVALTFSAIPKNYYKGYWARVYDGDDFEGWVANRVYEIIDSNTSQLVGYEFRNLALGQGVSPHKCVNEDSNFNGILDEGEDTNNDGKLTPGNLVTVNEDLTTDENGAAILDIRYAQSYGEWADIRLIASAKVTGSESFTQTTFTLNVLSTDVTDEDISPPIQRIGTVGPFGYIPDCSKNIEDEEDFR